MLKDSSNIQLGPLLVSDSDVYVIREKEKSALYVKVGTAAPYYCVSSGLGRQITYNGHKYQAHEAKRKFLRDCLHTAEEIMADKILPSNQVHSQVLPKGTLFGEDDAKNVSAAKLVPEEETNEMVAPAIRQAYAIVRIQPAGDGDYPYHAAAVVVADGPDRITIEVSAHSTDAKEEDRFDPGSFEMYSLTKKADTFHTRWEGTFGKDSITITLAAH